jgi:FkbM family methyltransferase
LLIPLSQLKKLHVYPRGVIHIGACYLEEAPIYQEWGVQNVLWIEANPKLTNFNLGKIAFLPGHRYYCYAIYNTDNQILTLNVTNNVQSSSLLKLKEHAWMYPHIQYIEEVHTTTRRLDTLLEEENINPELYDFVNLDIQGVELPALKGMTNFLSQQHVRWVYSEVNMKEMYENCTMESDLVSFLSGFGFKMICRSDVDNAWGDCLFERK